MPTTGNPEGSVPQVLQFNNNFSPAQATTSINYEANLPSTPTSGEISPSSYANDPVAGAEIVGTGATISPDAMATGTGTVSNLTNSTLLVGVLGIHAGDKITIGDGDNDDHLHRYRQHDRRRSHRRHNNGGSAQCTVTATLSDGNLKLTGDNDTAVVSSATPTQPSALPRTPILGFGCQQQFVQSDQSDDPGPERHLERVGRWWTAQNIIIGTGAGDVRDACAVADRRPRSVGRDGHGEYPERQYLAGGHGSDRDARGDWHRRRVAIGLRRPDDDGCTGQRHGDRQRSLDLHQSIDRRWLDHLLRCRRQLRSTCNSAGRRWRAPTVRACGTCTIRRTPARPGRSRHGRTSARTSSSTPVASSPSRPPAR